MSQSTDRKTPSIEIELIKPHRHAGRNYEPGHRLTLPEHKARWLISIGSAKEATAPSAPAAKSKE